MPFPIAPPVATAATRLLLLFLLILLHPVALCRAKPHPGFGHLGRTRPNHHPIPTKQPTPPSFPNSPAHHPAIPPPPPATPWRHHVFLNFRGPDVRHAFSDHLYYALLRKGITAFRDDRDLPRGENVTEAIPRAIEESKLSIVVLSRGYASSEYCLDELVKIMLTMKEKGHLPFPVFYKLSPDEVLDHQSSGCYKDDFDRHKRRYSYERVESWSHALTAIADISGWVLTSDRSEAEMVESIAKNMLWKVHELGRRESSVVASGASRQSSIRRDDDGDGGVVRICGTSNSGERNISLEKVVVYDHQTSTSEGEPVVTRQPAASGNRERGPFVPAFRPPAPEGSSDEPPTKPAGDSEEESITVERQAPAAREEEDDDQKRRLWMSRTCTTNSKNLDHPHHHHQLKFIRPEISPQGKKTVRIPKTVAQEEIKRFWDLSLIAQQLSNTDLPQMNTTTILKEANILWNISSSSSKGSPSTTAWVEVKQVGTTTNGLYIFTFSNQNTRDRVVESSPWCIANATFVMRKWQPNLQLSNLVKGKLPPSKL